MAYVWRLLVFVYYSVVLFLCTLLFVEFGPPFITGKIVVVPPHYTIRDLVNVENIQLVFRLSLLWILTGLRTSIVTRSRPTLHSQ